MTTRVDIAVLTAKVEEYAAFFKRLEEPNKWPGTKESLNQYAWALGTLPASIGEGKFKIALGLTHEQTNVPAALAALATFSKFQPRYIVFMGIAGSLDQSVRKGDVLMADYIRAYQYGRMLEGGAFEPYMQFQEPTDQVLRTNAAAFAQTTEWWRDIGDRPDGAALHPILHFGGLASGDAVIENAESIYFAAVRKSDNWLRAVEMESAGLALAVRHLKESGYVTGLMVLRGISDMPAGIEGETSSTQQGDANRATRKQWTEYASKAAAQFLEQFIKNGFPYSPEAQDERHTQPSKKQFDPDVFASYQSHFVRADELRTIHRINDQTFEASTLVPTTTLESWWRANPLAMRLISSTGGEIVGYWQILLLKAQAFRGLLDGQLTERQINADDILSYQELKAGSVYVYVTAVSVLEPMQHKSASVMLDLIAFMQLLDETIGIDGISAQAVSDYPLNLMARFGMVRVDNGRAISTWVLDSPEQIRKALQTGRRHLARLKGMIPDVPRDEHRSLIQLLRR